MVNKSKIITLTQVQRYKIIKPVQDGVTWKTLGSILRTLQQETCKMQNETSFLAFEYFNITQQLKEKTGAYPDLKTNPMLGMGKTGKKHNTSLQNYCYTCVTDDCKGYSENIVTSIKRVTDKYSPSQKSDAFLNKLRNFEVSPPYYKQTSPIDIVNFTVGKEDTNYYIDLKLLSKKYQNELNMTSSSINVLIDAGKYYSKNILNNIINGNYKACTSQLLCKDKEWFINICYQVEVETNPTIIPDRILGIDMGIHYPVYASVFGTEERTYIEGGEIEAFRNKVEKRKRQLQRQTKFCSESRKGHGRKTRYAPSDAIRDKISNFSSITNHKYAKYIVEYAVKNQCGIIQMEDLSDINKKHLFLKDWTYFTLQKSIEDKAKKYGIIIKKINPKYTSLMCSKCHHISKENRDGKNNQSLFLCVNCGHKTNADYNASINISNPDVENIIKKKCEELNILYSDKANNKKQGNKQGKMLQNKEKQIS